MIMQSVRQAPICYIYPYEVGFIHWHWSQVMECRITSKDMGKWISTKPQLTTTKGKPCAYLLGYTVCDRSIFMMTSSNGHIFRVTGPLRENSPVTGEFPWQTPVTRSFKGFFDLRLNKRLSKHSGGWWFKTPSRSLWRHCNVWICWHIQVRSACAYCRNTTRTIQYE